MKKLLKQLLKEDILDILPWLFIPLIGVFAGLSLVKVTGFEAFYLITVLCVTVLMLGPLIALIILAGNDYNRFYGKYSALYSTYPLSSNKVTLVRLLNYTILGIFTGLTFIMNMFISLPTDLSLGESFREISRLLSNLTMNEYLQISKLIGTFLGLGLMLALTLMAANSIGNSYYFKKLGKLGPVLVGVVLVALENFIQIKVLAKFAVDRTILAKVNMTINFFETNYIFVAVVILELVILYLATNYFHEKKLSVA